MHAQIMQDEAATMHVASLLGKHGHCTQSTASAYAATAALKPLLSQNLALQFRLPSKQEMVHCNIQN